ncbi:TetR/AcrR family transcriptional regulator [Aestuariicella hydrocarbonica]|uniref:TetR/AcrR family transcriptional regulator n=1 Tax=Pseudomaricurvus hydrocarbonicus TaxID=1470433 RepID=A0A9E5JY41_9GAMM|nr:TetR/AcrR family transcriptional regulator [Aestuariicella hydrocarbonica]NHO66735.1 TetR/AcrR family transcriptional regulator [Aestuariicella hydrocarbonica]
MNHKVTPETQLPKKRATRTRDALCKALLSLLEEKALEQITVKEITAEANVGYATFFRRYPDKESLLHDLAASEIRKLLAMTLPIFYTEDTLASTQTLCAYVWENKAIWRALLTGGAAATLKEEYLQQALALAEETSSPKAWLPDELAVTFAVTAAIEILSWWLKQSSPPSVKEMAYIVNRLAISPIYLPT